MAPMSLNAAVSCHDQAIGCGDFHAILVTKDGKVFTTGQNSYGQLGVGDTTGRSYLVPVSTLHVRRRIALTSINGDN